jgi:hypothetical protein
MVVNSVYQQGDGRNDGIRERRQNRSGFWLRKQKTFGKPLERSKTQKGSGHGSKAS